MSTKYMYFREGRGWYTKPEWKENGGITLGILKDGVNNYSVAIAVCSEADKFRGKIGRELVDDRLSKRKNVDTKNILTGISGDYKFTTILFTLFNEMPALEQLINYGEHNLLDATNKPPSTNNSVWRIDIAKGVISRLIAVYSDSDETISDVYNKGEK